MDWKICMGGISTIELLHLNTTDCSLARPPAHWLLDTESKIYLHSMRFYYSVPI